MLVQLEFSSLTLLRIENSVCYGMNLKCKCMSLLSIEKSDDTTLNNTIRARKIKPRCQLKISIQINYEELSGK
jgi:hypothetical protein